jgi:hypothetical protein
VSPIPAYSGAFVLRDALVKLGGTSFGNQMWKAVLTPDTPIVQQRTLVPDGTISDVDSATWVLELEGLQDHETGGLAAYLRANAGAQVAFELAPRNTAGKVKATGTVIAVNAPVGGEQGEFTQFEIELPVIGQPTFGTV